MFPPFDVSCTTKDGILTNNFQQQSIRGMSGTWGVQATVMGTDGHVRLFEHEPAGGSSLGPFLHRILGRDATGWSKTCTIEDLQQYAKDHPNEWNDALANELQDTLDEGRGVASRPASRMELSQWQNYLKEK